MAAGIVDRLFTDARRPHAPAGQPLQIPDSIQKRGKAMLAQIQMDWRRAHTDLLEALDRAHLSLGDVATSEKTLESEAADHLFTNTTKGINGLRSIRLRWRRPARQPCQLKISFPKFPTPSITM
jgi:hypothetical protein